MSAPSAPASPRGASHGVTNHRRGEFRGPKSTASGTPAIGDVSRSLSSRRGRKMVRFNRRHHNTMADKIEYLWHERPNICAESKLLSRNLKAAYNPAAGDDINFYRAADLSENAALVNGSSHVGARQISPRGQAAIHHGWQSGPGPRNGASLRSGRGRLRIGGPRTAELGAGRQRNSSPWSSSFLYSR